MAFKPAVQPNTQSQESSATNSDGFKIDWKAVHDNMIAAAGTAEKQRNIPAYISGYYDLGKQARQPFECIYDPNSSDFANMEKDVAEGKATVRTGNINIEGKWHNDVEIFSKPLPPRNAISWCVTFPQISIDDGKLFNEPERAPHPLNIILGGEFWAFNADAGRKENIIQNLTYVQENTNNPSGTWGFGTTTNLHKMGAALGLLNEHGLLTKDKLGDFLGKPLQFKLRLWNKPSKNGGEWYTEECKFVSEVPEGLPVPEFDEAFIHGINFHEANDPETVKHLNRRIINTMKRAEDFEGSVIQKELIEYGMLENGGDKSQSGDKPQASDKPAGEPVNGNGNKGGQPQGQGGKTNVSKPQQTPVYNEPLDFDDQIPFAPIALQYRSLLNCM